MKQTVFIFHGTGGHSQENWFPWLKEKLEHAGCDVFVPQFPTPDGQSLDAWLTVIQDYKDRIDEETIFIGHSLGGIFLLRLVERLPHKVKAAMFVGTPVGIRPMKNYDSDFHFSGFDFDWDNIQKKSTHFG